ncbi:MAG: aldo/keto reductase [Clostridiales bacterium]|nr:aldo/keto reductase [Clostridiales bacterium]
MKYRTFGKTGDRVSVLGMGGGRFPEKERNGISYPLQEEIDRMLRMAYEGGINYFDTAPLYCSGNCESAVGKAVKPFRDQVFLAAKLKGEDAKAGRYFEALEKTLSHLETDYVDYYYFWGIGEGFFDEYILKLGFLKEAYRAKEQGLIRHVSFSFHGVPEEIRHIIDKAEQAGYPFESVLVQYNFLDRSNEQMLTYAHQKGLGTAVMGPAGGGRLTMPMEYEEDGRLVKSIKSVDSGKLTMPAGDLKRVHPEIPSYELALRYVIENTDVDCTLSGMSDVAMVKENLRIPDRCYVYADYEDESWSNESREGVNQGDEGHEDVNRKHRNREDVLPVRETELIRRLRELYCTGCRYCQPCPAGIQIQDIFQFYIWHHVYGLTEHAKNQYRDYRERGRATWRECLDCGACEARCPQKLPIRKELRQADACLTDG